jgi:phosphatidylserine/phosphatidylglycerophosphate/cardiolipin synthase-like enzyme
VHAAAVAGGRGAAGRARLAGRELPPAWPELLVAQQAVATGADAAAAWRDFPPYDAVRRFTVRPLLTPDNHHRHVLALVRGAREELLIQNQTFAAPKAGEDALRALVEAVIARQRAGVRVRIIFRTLLPAQTRHELERLKEYGLDLAGVKVQVNCHTKGIVVDRRRVLIGSQNWSNHGVSVNRDASLLFEDAPLAEYFA